MSDTRLAVIVPFYNETAYIGLALNSILAQGIPDTEIIVVNDNPAEYDAAAFERMGLPRSVRVLHHPVNLGLSAARNSGIAATTARRIAFLDADDYYLAEGLTAQLAFAEQTGADITHANCCLSTVGSPALTLLPRDRILFSSQKTGAGLKGVEQAQFITSSWSSIYRRDFLIARDLLFDEAQVKFEDRLFVLHTVTAAERIACLGKPVRVWRRRAGSISVTKPDLAIHRLQVQLLEKCMAHMRAHAAAPDMPQRFLRREVFNTLSRLIWDMDVLPLIARGDDPDYADLGQRITALLGEDRFGQQIFDDPVLKLVSRVGMQTRKMTVRRQDFFDIHRQLRDGNIPGAVATIDGCRASVAAPAVLSGTRGRHLVLHIGMHKTGSTYLQRGLMARQGRLRAAGALFPKTGLAGDDFFAVRQGGFPGHLGLLVAARNRDGEIWQDLAREIADSKARTVILSCENMLAPITDDREALLSALFHRLSEFETCQVVAFARRPDHWAEMFYRELVCNGQRRGARSLPEFLVDYAAALTDYPALFAPFEAFSNRPVILLDHEAARRGAGHWACFMGAAGLETLAADRPDLPASHGYATPDREQVAAARLLNSMLTSEEQRMLVLRGFFATHPPRPDPRSALSPAERLALVEAFAATSAPFAAARGYAPDLDAIRAELAAEVWEPPAALSGEILEGLLQARLQVERPAAEAGAPPPKRFELGDRGTGGLTIRIRPRPWLSRLLGWVTN
ncbi:glycosyltransferase family 2 protein [Pseudotabrizicola algicola]|uniref:Glycosyltransferase family 2 protein n=1 Tax=Pseudotabrizicola algicola TaxID=2709381 RepID=A0A6B3RIR8_9RHOB|nr:glycosyltransferase family 2 protein [Pseudotabrizicola algicola]NEX45910.1 glycosyltransferase family 2 protein [Pseudotabrizicola algicola]